MPKKKIHWSEISGEQPKGKTLVAFGCERFEYTLDQMKWIAESLAVNGGRISAVLEVMTCRDNGFGEPLKTAHDSANWCIKIEQVKRLCELKRAEFTEEWDREISLAYQAKL